ncbi:MAG TPA: M56 family metallopeptidase [Allosphingosinicella sp.]|nr:M56 family metallopeptidase [Allosphingosinicella sp.]
MIDWLIETSIAVTLLMVLVLALRRPVAHFFGAGWAYALWALPALRLVLPPLPLFGDAVPSLLPARASVPAHTAPASAPPIEAAASFEWEPLLLAAWLGGAAAIILWQAISYLAFVRRLGIGSRVHASFAQDVGVIESAQVEGPLAIGLLDKWIVVPADFTTRYSEREQRLALEHERVHHQREDIFWNMVALGVLALNWFNPIAYLAFRAFRTDQELSCDAAVAARASAEERHDYALALVKSASRPGLIAACPLNHAGQLKRRLKMIKAHRRSRVRALGGSSSVAALLLAGISVTQTPSIAAPEAAPVAPPPAAAPSPAVALKAAPVRGAAPAPHPPALPARPKRLARSSSAAPAVKAATPAEAVPPSAPPAVTAPAEAVALAPPPPAPQVLVVRLEGTNRLAVLDSYPLPARQVRLVRTRAGHGPKLDWEIKAQLEKFLAARTEEANQIHITLKDE